ncbi:MAG: Gx transporter family protein [Treponema sp.]|nr:Gx transporter family protein [Treponema sp.]
MNRNDERTDLALLGALCLFLSALDYLIPKPLPFMRIGLANFPLLIALQFFSIKNFFLLAFVKVAGQALITGTLFSYVLIFSLTGTALSAVTMALLYRRASLVGTSIAGAFMSNVSQLVLARFILFGDSILFLTPPFLMAGIISGGLLGFFAMNFSEQSEWLKWKRENTIAGKRSVTLSSNDTIIGAYAVLHNVNNTLNLLRAGLSVFLAAVFLLVPQLPFRAALFLLFWFLAMVFKVKTRPLFTIISMAMITLCNLFPPFGKVLLKAGPVIVAEGSLLLGLQRAVTMSGLIMFSRLALLSVHRLPGKFGALLQECFGILDKMNSIFFGGNKKNSGSGTEKISGGLIQKLDRLLCEISVVVR